MVVSGFRPKDYGASDPVIPTKRMRSVSGLEAGSLALQVIEILVAQADEVFLAELSIEVVQRSPFRREASEFIGPIAVSSI